MTAVEPAYVCNEVEARDLTDQIKGSVEKTWRLLLNAHEWKAWAALGYSSWRDYAMTEFGLSQSRAYQLLDAAKVVREIEAVSTMVELTEREARDLKPHLPEVTAAVADAVADLPEDERPAAAAAAVKTTREQFRPSSSPSPEHAPVATAQPTSPGGGEPDVPDLTGVNLSADQYRAKVTALGETLPVEQWEQQQEPSSAELTAQVHASLENTDSRFLGNLLRGITGTNSNLLALDPGRAVEVCARNEDERDSLLAFFDRFETWSSTVRNGLRPALRRIK